MILLKRIRDHKNSSVILKIHIILKALKYYQFTLKKTCSVHTHYLREFPTSEAFSFDGSLKTEISLSLLRTVQILLLLGDIFFLASGISPFLYFYKNATFKYIHQGSMIPQNNLSHKQSFSTLSLFFYPIPVTCSYCILAELQVFFVSYHLLFPSPITDHVWGGRLFIT